MKRISYMILFSLFFFLAGGSLLRAQIDTVLYDQFNNGDGLWTSGWIDATNTSVVLSIDTTGKLSGKNSYKLNITNGGSVTYLIQRNANCPLVKGYQYTLSFMAVANKDSATINALFEIAGSPYTKRLNEIVTVDSTAKVFTFTMSATENVPDNQVKLHFGSHQNDNTIIWVDSVIVTRIPDPTLVSQWGRTSDGYGAAWPILNDSSTAAGDASIAGSQPMPSGTNGASLRGAFDTLTATMDKAVVVMGQLEYVGGGMGSVYTPLRYALTFQDSLTLNHQYTDTAFWVSTKKHFGYEFTPRSGTGVQPNGAGGGGSVWTINNGNWASTYSNGGKPIGLIVNQAPRNAEIKAGTYNFAISVMQVSDTTNEIRWYLVKTDNSYWFGGTVVDTNVTEKFNGVAFWLKDGDATQFNVKGVRAFLGDPVTVPAAPWQAYFLDQWGVTTDGYGAAWKIQNDSSYQDGDGTIAGPQPMPTGTNGASIRGGFGQDVSIPTDKALIVSGQLEYVGGGMGDVYTPLRYAITYQDSLTLNYQYTDSAQWVSPKKHYGFEFTPRTGTGVQPNGAGGGGSVWTIINGNWASTYSNGGGPVGPIVNQAPRNAVISEGKYNWAISVQQVNDTTDEVRWYIEKVHAAGAQSTYWFGGIVQAKAVTNKLNGVSFWLKDGDATQFNIIAAKIDKNTPITLPQVPWQQFYIPTDQWGIYATAGGWKLAKPDVDGNASISGSGPVASSSWANVRGGFGQSVLFKNLPPDTALVVTGKMQFVGGGFDGWSGLRFGIFYSDSAGTVDSTADGPMWSGKDSYSSGYLLCPNSGTNDNPTWGSLGNGSVGGVINSKWYSTNGNNYILSNLKTTDVAGAGTYNFKLSFKDMGSQGIAVGYSITGPSYYFIGHMMDTSSSRPTKFNSVNFAVSGTNANTTGLNISDVLVDLGSPVITGVNNDENNNALPMVYSLSQNYPNPFNPTTTIKFGLPKAGDVSLVVYDILGRKVAELINGNMTAGYHTINFNAVNLASGVYFYRIKAGDFVSVKKLMLLK
jgi:hypothetical protein